MDTNSTTGVFKFVLPVLTLITCVPYHPSENVALPVNCPKKVVPLDDTSYMAINILNALDPSAKYSIVSPAL